MYSGMTVLSFCCLASVKEIKSPPDVLVVFLTASEV